MWRRMVIEAAKISQMMNELFRTRREKPEQTVRYLNVKFDRLIRGLQEVKCDLDKLKLNEGEELASTGHWFEEKLHQQASGLMCGDGGVAGGDFGAEIAVIGAAARLASLDTAMRT